MSKSCLIYPLQFASLGIEAKPTGATGNPVRAFLIGVQMKKEVKKSAKPRLPLTPFTRGDRTCKQRGELAEIAFLHKAANMGFGVASPTETMNATTLFSIQANGCGGSR